MIGSPRWMPRGVAGRVLLAGLALIVVATGVFVAWPRDVPTTAGQSPSPGASADGGGGNVAPPRIPISVSASLSTRTPPLTGRPTEVSGHALGEAAIVTLELWDGDRRVAVYDAPSTSPALSARWDWVPEEPGRHLLGVRALDALGRMRQSNALWVDVADGGATASVPNARLAGTLSLPHPSLELPAVQASLDGCEVSLDVTSPAGSAGFTVYALPPQGIGFVPLASLAASPATTPFVVPAGGGTSAYVIGAFDATVELLGPPILIEVPDECGAGEWSGGLALDDGMLIGGPSVDRAYLYLQQGTDAGVRVPAGTAFVNAVDGALDFDGLLPTLKADEPFSIEAWGWHDGNLVSMGHGSWSPPPPASNGGPVAGQYGGPPFAAGTITSLHALAQTLATACGGSEICWVDEPVTQATVAYPGSQTSRVLQWSTHVSQVTSIVWQLLPYAPGPAADLTPPFMVDDGVIEVPPGTTSGEFSIDFADYLGTPTATVDNSAPQSAVALAPLFGGQAPTPLPPASPTPGAGGGAGGLMAKPSIGQLIPSSIGNQAYVRIIPMQGLTPAIPSNHVRFDIVPPPDKLELVGDGHVGFNQDAYSVEWSFTPPKAADPKFARCAVVTGFTDDYVPPPAAWPWTYHVGDGFCYTPPDDDGILDIIEDGFEAFVDLVENVWSEIQDGYAWIQDQVVKVLLATVPCQQVADDAVCETIAKTALSVALASMGVPPTLPDFDTVMQGLKGDLRDLVLEAAASQVPGVAEACGLSEAGQAVGGNLPSCEALVDQAVDEIVAQVEAQVSDAAGGATGKAYPGVIFAPDPRGVYQVPTVTMTLTRTSALPLPSVCTATATMTSVLKNHSWQEVGAGHMVTKTGTVSGQPFLGESFTIPPLQPGESITRTVWLAHPGVFFESYKMQEYQFYLDSPIWNRAWVLLQAGVELTFGVGGNCMPSSTQGPIVLTQAAIND